MCVSVCVLSHQHQELLLCVLLWFQFPQENPPWTVCECSSSFLSLSLFSHFLGSFSLFQGCFFGRKAPSSPPGRRHTHRRRSAFRCDGRDVALVGRRGGGRSHKTRVRHICRCTRQSQRTLSILPFSGQAGRSLPTAKDSQTCFHGLLLSTLNNQYCQNMTDAIYIPIALQLRRVEEEPRYKARNVNSQQTFSRPLWFLYRIRHLSKSGCLQKSRRRTGGKKRKVKYNSQFSSILKPTAGLADHRTLVSSRQKLARFVKYLKSSFVFPSEETHVSGGCCLLLSPAGLLFLEQQNKTLGTAETQSHAEIHKPRVRQKRHALVLLDKMGGPGQRVFAVAPPLITHVFNLSRTKTRKFHPSVGVETCDL